MVFQRPQIGSIGIGFKIRLLKAGDGGADGAQSAQGGHMARQPPQRNPHSHTALGDGKGEGVSGQRKGAHFVSSVKA